MSGAGSASCSIAMVRVDAINERGAIDDGERCDRSTPVPLGTPAPPVVTRGQVRARRSGMGAAACGRARKGQ